MVQRDVANHTRWVFEGPVTQGYFRDVANTIGVLERIQLTPDFTADDWAGNLEELMEGICFFLTEIEERFSRTWKDCMFSQKDKVEELLSGLERLSQWGTIPDERVCEVVQKRSVIQELLIRPSMQTYVM
jgi:hypothetical protein